MTLPTLDTRAVAYQRRSIGQVMRLVIVALIPGIVLYTLLIDRRLPVNLLLAATTALLLEALLVRLRKRPVVQTLRDSSIVLASMLLVLSVPQSLPTWQLVFGVFTLCTLGKHLFGGLGHNPFNPAMVAYALLLTSFPLSMTQWTTQHGLLDSAAIQDVAEEQIIAKDIVGKEIVGNEIVGNENISKNTDSADRWDSITGATPLDRIDSLQRQSEQRQIDDMRLLQNNVPSASNTGTESTVHTDSIDSSDDNSDETSPAALIFNSDWVWVNVAWLLGGLYLLYARLISWRIPVAILLTLGCVYGVYGLFATEAVLTPVSALLSGAILFGAFFIATDPVSAATSNTGRWVYGIGIALLCFFIREFSAYPEGFAFAVLLMNMCVPLIDHACTRNRLAP